jgi:DNA-binding GntR family transcriptional regulator
LAGKGIINLMSLKDQVYEYLRNEMKKGRIKPGSTINMDRTSEKLGVSKTPLRDALIRLEAEGFVNILPRKGVVVSPLSLQNIRDYYQIIGALESTALLAAESRLCGAADLMAELNDGMCQALAKESFDLYYERNLRFHEVFIRLSGNSMIEKTVDALKKRLYDFPRPKDYIKAWEERSVEEHSSLVSLIKDGRVEEAARLIRDVHWSFKVQEPYILQYYAACRTDGEERDE